MARYEINGGHPLNGTVTISGAKNAAVAILPAALLVSGKCRIENVPNISDVRILMSILDGMGAKIVTPEPGVVEIDCADIHCSEPDQQLVRRMRASYYLMGALLGRFGRAHVALPGGCNFASRPIDQHIKGFLALGADVDETEEYVALTPVRRDCMAAGSVWTWRPWARLSISCWRRPCCPVRPSSKTRRRSRTSWIWPTS